MANYERSPKGQVRRPSRPEHVVAFEFLRTYYDRDDSDDGAIQKSDVYEEYQSYCQQHGYKPLVAADFGRVLKSVFPNSRDRRLGSRGSSKYCYVGVRRRNSLRSPLPTSRPQEPVTDAELCHAYEAVICEWASTVLSRPMSNLQELATYLLGQRFVQTRSCSALTIMSAHKHSIDRLHLEVPLNKHRETQLKLQEKLMQRMAQRRREPLPSSSSPGSTAGDVTAAASPAAFSPAAMALRDGFASGSSSPLHHTTPALATRTNTAPSSCRSTPVPPSSCDSSARSTPMGGLTNDVFHPSSATAPPPSSAATSTLSSVQLRPADHAHRSHGNGVGSSSLAEAFATAWADSNRAAGGGAPLRGRWAAAGCDRRPWPSAALVSAAAAASSNGGVFAAAATGSRLMVRSEPCTPTPWQRAGFAGGGGLLDDAPPALLQHCSGKFTFPSVAPFGQAREHDGFQPLRFNCAWADGCGGGYVESCPGSAVSSPVTITEPASLTYDPATGAEAGADGSIGRADPDVFQQNAPVDDSLMDHFLSKADDDGGGGTAGHGQLVLAADSHSTVGSGSNGSICSELAAAAAAVAAAPTAGVSYVCGGGSGLSPDYATGGSSFFGLFDTRHASAFVPVGRALAKGPGNELGGLSSDADACSGNHSGDLLHLEANKKSDHYTSDRMASVTCAAPDAEHADSSRCGLLPSTVTTSSGELVGDQGSAGGTSDGGAGLHSTDEDFADLMSIIDGSLQQDSSRTAAGDSMQLQPWHSPDYRCPLAAEASASSEQTCRAVLQQPSVAAAMHGAPSRSSAASMCHVQVATSLPREQQAVHAAAMACARPLQISIKYPSISALAQSASNPSQPALFSRHTSCVQVKPSDTPPVTPTGNFRPVITPNSELRRWCNGGSGWPGLPGGGIGPSAADGEGCTTPVPLPPLPPSSADAERNGGCSGYQGQNGFAPSGAMSPPLHPPKKRKHLSGDAMLSAAALGSAPAASHRGSFTSGLVTMQQQPPLLASHQTVRQLALAADDDRPAGGSSGSRAGCTLRDLLLAGPGQRAALAATAAAAVASSASAMESALRFGSGGHDFAARRNLTEALLSPPCDLASGQTQPPPPMPSHSSPAQSNSRAGASSSLSMPTPPSSKTSTPDRFA